MREAGTGGAKRRRCINSSGRGAAERSSRRTRHESRPACFHSKMKRPEDSETREGPRGPCPFAMAAMAVPARRWDTRADLMSQLHKAEQFMKICPLDGFTVRKAASEVGLSLHHFLRLFREVYAMTPYQYIAKRRIELAKSLLASTEKTVLEVAFEAGFVNASAFARSFRKAVGTTPSRFRSSI